MSLAEGLRALGLPGLFLASFLGHFSIIMKDILFVPIFLYMSQFWNPMLLGLVGGTGAGIGSLSAYLIGRSVGKFTVNKDNRGEIPVWARKLGLFSVLLCSLTPLPDAPVLMLLGSAHLSVFVILTLEVVGKIILYTSMAIAGGIFYSNLAGTLPAPWDSVLIISVSLSFSVIVTWKRTRAPLVSFGQNMVNKIRKYAKKV